jgi:hypothetical protein
VARHRNVPPAVYPAFVPDPACDPVAEGFKSVSPAELNVFAPCSGTRYPNNEIVDLAACLCLIHACASVDVRHELV